MNNIEKYNVVWDTPSKNSAGSMPIGNGDIGLNVWVEEDGDLMIYLGKTDTWDENCRLLKVGRIRVELMPNPFKKDTKFCQTLNLIHGEILIEANDVSLRIWVDANNPVAHVEIDSEQKINCSAQLEIWRTALKPLSLEDKRNGRNDGDSDGSHSESGLVKAGLNPMITPDIVVPQSKIDKGSIAWYHRNESSIWSGELCHQGLDEFANNAKGPLLAQTFGGILWGDRFENQDDKTVVASANQHHKISICLLTMQADSADIWLDNLNRMAHSIKAMSANLTKNQHDTWRKGFWDRSTINVTGGGEETDTLSKMWHLQRYTIACAARGVFPLKFNGSIFNTDGNHDVPNANCSQGYDADFRGWGGCYWFQNQRQIYWAMLASGDFDEMMPFFKMYLDALPLAKYMTKTWFKHEGAFFLKPCIFGEHTAERITG